MKELGSERRKYPRYDTELQVYYAIKYDTHTRIEYRVVEALRPGEAAHKHFGICKNVSAEGLCFTSKDRLKQGDILLLEVYEPAAKDPVKMEGEVRWSARLPGEDEKEKEKVFHTGVQIVSVGGRSVSDTIYFDKEYKVMWSVVLESLFGTFAAMTKKAVK